MQWFMLLFIFPCLLSCQRLSNTIDAQLLDCGELAQASGLWIKVLDPEGKELPETEVLDARILELNDEGNLANSLPVSQKHCVSTRGASRLVIRSLAQGRSWAVLVDEPDQLPGKRVRLQDNSQDRVRLRCPEPWIHSGRVAVPLEIQSPSSPVASAMEVSIENEAGDKSAQGYSLLSSNPSLIWPAQWLDGQGLLTLRQKNFLQNPQSALAEKVDTCPFTVDRRKPLLNLTPAPESGREMEMQPGALLRIEIDDLHPAQLQWCLEPKDKAFCDQAESWQNAVREISLPMPEQGSWIIKARAQDAAGNEANPLAQVIHVVRGDLVQGIGVRVDQALAEKGEQSWAASISLLLALKEYGRLAIEQEQKLIRRKLADGILAVMPYLHEYQRITLSDSGLRSWPLDEPSGAGWLVLSGGELAIWSREGLKLDAIKVPPAVTADWSASERAFALSTQDELWVIPMDSRKFSEPLKLRWKDQGIDLPPKRLQWIPRRSQILVTEQNYDPAIIVRSGNDLQVSQRLASEDTIQFGIAPSGNTIATVDGNQTVRIWTWNSKWMEIDSKELSVSSFLFATSAGVERLMMLLKDGRLVTWTEDLPWKETDAGAPLEVPTEGAEYVLITPGFNHIQAWAGGEAGILERGGRFYEWSSAPTSFLQALRINGFDWDSLITWKTDPCDKGVWLQDHKTLSYWVLDKDAESRPTFKKLDDWVIPDMWGGTSFSVSCGRDGKRFVTLNRNTLSFWSQKSPLNLVQGDKNTVVVSSFIKGGEEAETLFTAGFDHVIRLWEKSGRKIQEWLGHSGQVNEVRYIPEWRVYASSAEDYTTRLWKANGEAPATLTLNGVPRSVWRYGALAFDQEHLMTAGRGVIALWSNRDNETKLTITIPVGLGEETGVDSMVRLPSGPRIMVRLVKGRNVRALIVEPDGTLVSEPSLPELQDMRGIDWTPDGARIALTDANQKTRIFHYESSQWKEELFTTGIPAGLSRLAFAPDGTSFAAVGAGKNLVIGQRVQGRWSLLPSIPLASTTLDKGLQWTPDSSRLVYAQAGQVFVRDREGVIQHQFQAFPGTDPLSSLGLSQDPEVLAVGSGPWVRIIDLNLSRLQTQLCTWLDAWIRSPDAPPEFSELCTQ